jgi:hypothetical protein
MKIQIQVEPDNFRSLRSPHDEGIRTQFAIVALQNVPRNLPLSPNPRVPKPNAVIRRVRESLERNDGVFHILNRGITVSAKTSVFNNSTGVLEMEIPEDDERYGILDGGHTYYVLQKALDGESELDGQYVKFEILSGVEPILADIASARNFSKQVKDVTLANYSKRLEWLKDALGEKVSKNIRWRENDEEAFDVLEYVQVITAFHVDRYKEGSHPLESYNNAGKCLEHAEGETLHYLVPVIPDICRLYDTMRLEWWEKYKIPGEDGRFGRPGRRKEVNRRQRGKSKLMTFPSLDPEVENQPDYHVERGLVIPLIAAFRVLIDRAPDQEVRWKIPPLTFWSEHGSSLVRKVMEASEQRNSNPQIVGRDKTVYEALYDAVELAFLKSDSKF